MNQLELIRQLHMGYASKQNLKVINDTYPCLELENLKFDNIFIFHVIEHVANPVELLVNIKKFKTKWETIY